MNLFDATADRRQFLKTFVLGTAASVGAGSPWKARVLGEILPDYIYAGTLTVKISDHPPLSVNKGSVRLSLNPVSQDCYPSGLFYPIVISRASAGVYHVLSSQCTHYACVTEKFSTPLNSIPCNWHGSRFTIDGTRISGPAVANLTKYDFTYDGSNTLRITVPRLKYSVKQTSVQAVTGNTTRLCLTVGTNYSSQYEVRFQSAPGAAWQVVPFALTPTGDAIHTSVFGTGDDQSVYVDSTSDSGFYTVVIKPIVD